MRQAILYVFVFEIRKKDIMIVVCF